MKPTARRSIGGSVTGTAITAPARAAGRIQQVGGLYDGHCRALGLGPENAARRGSD
ncbi:glutamyl-Q tRNA(Asp) synthetase [Candidatus Erwinia dacicola]|uniref:Glutamyl-Q tRNA(Asp) synthetase n=1 Tax=Candidatus Erwinia dacicola TaxID=252393 RepID=A0A328TPK8_9GAMM|nr:glutamyl-Q tRNA(Asp) synthetase [Candidatus Erwinia dacicola]